LGANEGFGGGGGFGDPSRRRFSVVSVGGGVSVRVWLLGGGRCGEGGALLRVVGGGGRASGAGAWGGNGGSARRGLGGARRGSRGTRQAWVPEGV